MGPALFDFNMRLIQLSVIQLSGGHCTCIFSFIKNTQAFYHSKFEFENEEKQS
jgi:hypothetical protein